MKMPLMENGTPEHCLECIGKMEINCAWCSEPILIGDPITLHKSKDPSKMPGNAVRYDKDPDFFVGCLRWDCADTGGDRCGFWMPPGKVHRVPSPIEVAISSGNIVFVQDLSNPKNLGKLL
ncbi:MAG: hypothetical protein KBD10_01190 [Candidatus Pacebacteria bacterium]|nr:hypothetical protein [Candidatus Paceibacterota bacterium]